MPDQRQKLTSLLLVLHAEVFGDNIEVWFSWSVLDATNQKAVVFFCELLGCHDDRMRSEESWKVVDDRLEWVAWCYLRVRRQQRSKLCKKCQRQREKI